MADFGMSIWLIQRCKMRSVQAITGVDSLFEYDYMGSAEFEFGGLSRSLERICANLSAFEPIMLPVYARDGKRLILICSTDDPLLYVKISEFLKAEARLPQHLKTSRNGSKMELGQMPGGISRTIGSPSWARRIRPESETPWGAHGSSYKRRDYYNDDFIQAP